MFEVFGNDIDLSFANVNKKYIKHITVLSKSFFFNAKYIYPSSFNVKGIACGIMWVPDFQHKHLHECFSVDEIKNRDREINEISDKRNPLILSSEDSLNDYRNFYGNKKNVYVMHFVSYIEPEMSDISSVIEKQILKKYGLNEIKYVYIANQFWKHKNHIIVLQAIRTLIKSGSVGELRFVFSGKMSDYRNPKYIEKIIKLFGDSEISEYCQTLGFLPREDQLVIMKNAQFLIQPSLFEGWGTVLEDAKVLDKRVILSDIPVHREQMNNRCVLFNPYDPKDLADKILAMQKLPFDDDIETGLRDMYARAKEYSLAFEQCIKENPYK